MAPLRIRQAVRALLLTPADEVLLVRFEFPSRQVWAMPGGGIEPGEDHVTALRRELIEEVGLPHADVGPCIWTREHVVPFVDGQWDGQREHVYLVRTPRFDPRPALSWDELRAERLHEIRWWSLPEVEAGSAISFAPSRFPEVLVELLANGPPTTPIDTGV